MTVKIRSNAFIQLADIAINDAPLQQAVAKGTQTAYQNRLNAVYAQGQAHGDALRHQAAEAKRRALRNLPDLLEKAEQQMQANGIQVLWAQDAAEANQHVLDIAVRHHVQRAAKGKSMVSEEISLNAVLQAAGIDVVETDLGEYIIQLEGSTPSHIIAPVIHKTKDSVRDLFVEQLHMELTDDAAAMVAFARNRLREVFISADMGITGGNFIIAETGSLVLVMNEGNGRMVTTLPRVHVAIVGIEKVIENLEDWSTLIQMLPRSGTGQQMSVYTNIISGPNRGDEADGPEHVYVILLDNGRSDIYAQEKYTEVLSCIRCGACQNACPVYRVTGGHAYGWVYGGPIGAVLTPLLVGLDQAAPLPQASSLCGACKAACPVDIDLPRMLLDLRDDIVQQGLTPRSWDLGMRSWAMAMHSPRMFELGGRIARMGLQTGADRLVSSPLGAWKQQRDFPDFAPKPFRQRWRERVQQSGEGTASA